MEYQVRLAMEPVRLLIVDENPKVRHALVRRLGSMPQVEVLGSAGDVREAREMVRKLSPDVVLIEPKRVDGQGFDLIQALASEPQHPLIIILTSYRDEDEEMIADQLGISRYILKDINSQALLDAILSLYRGRRQKGSS
ncbi:MAG TPA: response regulator transcription factor [Chloroflexi bacterium]|nr:response regulator transcription factor [Chloroflexota bacterium]